MMDAETRILIESLVKIETAQRLLDEAVFCLQRVDGGIHSEYGNIAQYLRQWKSDLSLKV